MKSVLFLILGLLAAVFVFALVTGRLKPEAKSTERPRAKEPLTAREKEMFFRLSEAFRTPEYFIFSQVAFTALLTAKAQSTRNGFNRKVADFVVCNSKLSVLAAVEIDDASHRNRETEDKARDALLINAGYRVLRYANVPSVGKLLSDLNSVNK